MKIAVCFSSDYMAHCEYQISHGTLLFLQKFHEINFFTVCGSITMMLLIDFTKVILRVCKIAGFFSKLSMVSFIFREIN